MNKVFVEYQVLEDRIQDYRQFMRVRLESERFELYQGSDHLERYGGWRCGEDSYLHFQKVE